jgi:hypothetical protein
MKHFAVTPPIADELIREDDALAETRARILDSGLRKVSFEPTLADSRLANALEQRPPY